MDKMNEEQLLMAMEMEINATILSKTHDTIQSNRDQYNIVKDFFENERYTESPKHVNFDFKLLVTDEEHSHSEIKWKTKTIESTSLTLKVMFELADEMLRQETLLANLGVKGFQAAQKWIVLTIKEIEAETEE